MEGNAQAVWSQLMKSEISPLRVVVKALILFVGINCLYAWVNPSLGNVSAYNTLLPGRTRLPFGVAGNPYSVMVNDLDVMFASHVISTPKQPGEYRVIVIGDSSVWGESILAENSISEQWNRLGVACGDRKLQFYNLGYPHPSVIKDLLILDKAMEYEPDMVVWFVTGNTLIPRRFNPLLAANRDRATGILKAHGVTPSEEDELALQAPSLYSKTVVAERSGLARAIKLQVLGLLWKVTGKNDGVSEEIDWLSPDVEASDIYRGWGPKVNIKKKIMFDALRAGHEIANPIPVLVVNEPIYIATGQNSDIRYNYIYPRWAYDQYRAALAVEAQNAGWNYLDMWDAVPTSSFADTGLHPSAAGERLLIERIDPTLRAIACP
jgi:hypothetical protein